MTRVELALLLLATGFYAIHALVCIVGFFLARRVATAVRWGPLLTALALQTVFVVSRAVDAGGLPIATRLDSASLFLWVTAVLFLASARLYRLEGLAPLFWPAYAACAIAAWFLAGRAPAQRFSPERFWLLLHLVPVYVGYAGFAVASGAGLGYLVQERLLRSKGGRALWRNFPSLETLERVGRAALSLGFPPLTLGLVAGVVWAERASELLGRAWYADPKVVGGIVVWLFYSAVLHVRLFAKMRGRRAAWLTIAGFLLTLASFAVAHVYPSAEEPSSGAAPRSPNIRAET
jgi:ABC-type transport system involved in cytochrome c biogenesis permease subunit